MASYSSLIQATTDCFYLDSSSLCIFQAAVVYLIEYRHQLQKIKGLLFMNRQPLLGKIRFVEKSYDLVIYSLLP